MKNKEILEIIRAIGASYKEHFKIEKVRYHKIVLLMDADIDGHHITFLKGLICFIESQKPNVTIETRRNVIRGSIVPAAALEKMPVPKAFERMEDNHRTAIDKVVVSLERPLTKGPAQVRLAAPTEPGEYVVKVLVRPLTDAAEQDQTADVHAGHSWLTVAKPAN